jgi:hypothetical protein
VSDLVVMLTGPKKEVEAALAEISRSSPKVISVIASPPAPERQTMEALVRTLLAALKLQKDCYADTKKEKAQARAS